MVTTCNATAQFQLTAVANCKCDSQFSIPRKLHWRAVMQIQLK